MNTWKKASAIVVIGTALAFPALAQNDRRVTRNANDQNTAQVETHTDRNFGWIGLLGLVGLLGLRRRDKHDTLDSTYSSRTANTVR